MNKRGEAVGDPPLERIAPIALIPLPLPPAGPPRLPPYNGSPLRGIESGTGAPQSKEPVGSGWGDSAPALRGRATKRGVSFVLLKCYSLRSRAFK